jgi:hypothetical protein
MDMKMYVHYCISCVAVMRIGYVGKTTMDEEVMDLTVINGR